MSSLKSMFWWKLTFAASTESEESLLWKLDDLGINRVALQFSPEEPDQRTFFAWLPSVEWTKPQRKQLTDSLNLFSKGFRLSIAYFSWERIEEEDWSKSWKQYWQPDLVGQQLLILPAWLDVPKEYSHRIVLRLDPGSAFGTGSHPTTRLCLEALEKSPPFDLRVADLGCGSGILSLAALRLGAKEVFAVDTDLLAVRSSVENFQLNMAKNGCFSVFLGSVDELKDRLKGKSIDLVLCNILAPVIEKLAPSFNEFISPDGRAILSGLLVEQVPRLKKIFLSLGWEVNNCLEQDQWALLEITKQNTILHN